MANKAEGINVRKNGNNGINATTESAKRVKAVKAKKASESAIKTTVEEVQAVICETSIKITAETTLNELIRFARNDAVKKPKNTPKFGTLRRKANCVASYRSEDHRSSLLVFDNGFAIYETDGRTTAIDLDKISNVKYETTRDDLGMEYSDLDSEWLGDLPWTVALSLLGEDRVTHNLLDDRAHELIGEGDYDENGAEDEIKKSKKPNNPVFTAHIDDPETAYIRKETQNEIDWALSMARVQMTVKQAEAFELYYDQDMSLKRISEILGIGSQSASERVGWALKKIRKNMEQFL